MKDNKDTIQVMKQVDQLMKSKGLTRKPGRTKGSKNKVHPDFPISTKDMSKMSKIAIDQARDKELDKLNNLVARQDDLIAQLQDDLRDQKNSCEVLRDECNQFEEKIGSYREILKTLLEISE